RDFEEDVLHHVAAERTGELHGIAFEGNILEAPGLGGEDGGVTHLAGHRNQGKAHGAAGRVTGGPGFARAGVGRVAVGAQRGAVEPRVRDGVDDLLAGAAQQRGGDGGGGDADEQDVVEADAVEGVFEGKHTLNLVGLHHGDEDVAD